MNNSKTGRRNRWTRFRAGRENPDAAPVTEPRGHQSDRFTNLVFASLLLELPAHRQALTMAWQDSDMQALADSTHKLSGAVAYCDLPELADALTLLRRAIAGDEAAPLGEYFTQVTRRIDDVLQKTGYSQQ